MTAEIPQESQSRCGECRQSITLTRNNFGALTVECDCESQSVRVKEVLPEVWDV